MEAVAEKPRKKNKVKTKSTHQAVEVSSSSAPHNEVLERIPTQENLPNSNAITNQVDSKEVDDNIQTEDKEPPNSNPIVEEPLVEVTSNEAALVEPAVEPPITELAALNFQQLYPNLAKQDLASLSNIEVYIPQPKANIKPFSDEELKTLYHNSELEVLDQFSEGFVQSELRGHHHLNKQYLYELLVNYLRVRERITGNNLELAQLRGEYNNLQSEIWTVDVALAKGSSTCQDGKLLNASVEFNRGVFHKSTFQNMTRILEVIRESIFKNHILYTYSAEDLRLQIEMYIDQIVDNVLTVTQMDKKRPTSLLIEPESLYYKPYFDEIRISISILFLFQRKLIKDNVFLHDTRRWLSQLVAVLIRIANYQDHLFLVHHVLRCPSGIGKWAVGFVQAPLDLPASEPFGNYQINHVLTVLSVIMSPVIERKEFIKDVLDCQTNTWVVIDSDGEEDDETGFSLRENDLVAILNQMPLRDIFKAVLLIKTIDDKDYCQPTLITKDYILRLFAFSTVLLRLFHQGLTTYYQPKYNQFSKRLSRFIRHIVQFVTDQWEICLNNCQEVHADDSLMLRLQTEYDAFFLRAIYYLYSSQKLRAWQFLAVVPYNIVTTQTLWRIFYFLHMPDDEAGEIVDFSLIRNFKESVNDRNLEEKISNLEDGETYYLLNTFANMALARNDKDIDFISFCTMDILQVGFVSSATQDTCWKSAIVLLVHLTSKHPSLLSPIFKVVHDNIEKIGSLALNLYQELPLTVWPFGQEEFDLIQRLLLLYPVNSDETKLARMILSRVNWDIISYEIHCQTALLVLKATNQEPTYVQWGWQTVLRLKLHLSDHHFQDLSKVPELEHYELLLKGVRESQPLACFVAILMSTWGHLVPIVCTKGLKLLIPLEACQKHEAILFALYQLMPVFLMCQECIVNCDTFQDILVSLLNADRGYISYAKSFIVTQNTVLQQFGNMIETQIANFTWYNLSSPRLLVRLWMNSLVSITNWNKDHAVLYLLDVIARTTVLHPDSFQVVYDNLNDLYQAESPQETSGLKSVFRWGSNPTFLPNSLSQYPYLAYVFLELEHQEKELKTGLWLEVLKELSKQKGKINVDYAIKNATSTLKRASFNSGQLCIYRWAQQALDTPVDHPLLPLIWQKFFILFLTRLPDSNGSSKACVGESFFDGVINFAFFKRMKRRLQETIEFFKVKGNAKEKLCLFEAYLLWLEEPRLHLVNLLLQSFPAQYLPQLLNLIIYEDRREPWTYYLDQCKLMEDREAAIKLWRVANFREKTGVNQPLSNPGRGIESEDPMERIIRRLQTYDAITPPPDIVDRRIQIPVISFDNKEEMFKCLKPCFNTMVRFAQSYNSTLSELVSLNEDYKKLVPKQFSIVNKQVRKNVTCRGSNQTVHCSGAAIILINIQEAKRNETIDHEIHVNRRLYEAVLEKSITSPPLDLYIASVSIQQCIRILQQRLTTNPETAELGRELFYYILSHLKEDTTTYLPAKTLFGKCVEKLGQSHISGVEYEMPRLLDWMFRDPTLTEFVSPFFLPADSGSSSLLFMYSKIAKEMSDKDDAIYALLSKFEIDRWLNDKAPKLNQRSQFIKIVIEALCSFGFDPPINAAPLHSLYRKHLLTVFEYEFPEHYGEILLLLLKVSLPIATSVWSAILNSLAKPYKILSKAPLRDKLRQYAQNQKALCHQNLLDTADLLAHHFAQERLTNNAPDLYAKYGNYVGIYSLFSGMMGHGIIVSMVNTHQGLLGDKLSEKIWPYLREMFAPWLVPYYPPNMKEVMPWKESDENFADQMILSFLECLLFTLHTLPASSAILSFFWQWYASSFGHPAVKPYVLQLIHRHFVTLPWSNFFPSLVDLEYMLKISDHYLPDCHSFLGHIFISVPWIEWLASAENAPPQAKAKIQHYFLSLAIKLALEPNIKQKQAAKARAILLHAENCDWSAIEPNTFQPLADWTVMSCNSEAIFSCDPLNLDFRILELLKTVSGYHKPWQHISPELSIKRQMYVRAHVKLLSVYLSRPKAKRNAKAEDVCQLINRYLEDFDRAATSYQEMEIILKEILSVVNINEVTEIALQQLLNWIGKKTYGLTVKVLLKVLGPSVRGYQQLAKLYEATLTSFFNYDVNECKLDEPTWTEASRLIFICAAKPTEFEEVLIQEEAILTLKAILLQRISRQVDKYALLTCSIQWLEKIKMREALEPKVPLLWLDIINLALSNCTQNEQTSAAILNKFSKVLLRLGEDTGSNSWGRGLLSVIGLSKGDTTSTNFKFMCRAIAAYVLAQLPDSKLSTQKVRTIPNAPCAAGMPGGNSDCLKYLLEVEGGASQGRGKDYSEIIVSKIKDPSNSLHNANGLLWLLLRQFYMKAYLRDEDD